MFGISVDVFVGIISEMIFGMISERIFRNYFPGWLTRAQGTAMYQEGATSATLLPEAETSQGTAMHQEGATSAKLLPEAKT